jgi:agmatinase
MRLPHVRDLEGVDAAIVGIPTDGAVVYRTGARFGPEAIRSASVMLRNYNPLLRVNLVEKLSLVDYGDVPTVPGSTADSLERSRAGIEEVARAGVTTLCLGGDHTVLLAELRALTAVHGTLALIQLDSHHDLWDEYFGQKLFHGSVVRRAVEEGLIDPGRSIVAGLRGSLTEPADAELPARFGLDSLTYEELASLGPGGFSERVRERVGSARRPRVRPRDGHSRSRRALEPGGAHLRPLPGGARLPRLRLRRGLPALRPGRANRLCRCKCVL